MPNIRPLPDYLQKVDIEELNEVPECIDSDLEALRIWIDQQPHLTARRDDQFLVAFLRGCKYSLEKAKSKIDKFYTLRTQYPEFYTIQNVDNPRMLEIIRLGVGLSLPIPLNETGPRIHFIRPGCFSPDKFTFSDIMPYAHTFAMLALLEDDHANVNGFIDLMDMEQVTPSHFLQMSPGLVKKITTFSEDALPLRQKASHFINTKAGFETFFNLIKPFMPMKQQERLFVHGNNLDASFYKHIPQKYLPKEYGGENGSIAQLIADAENKFLEMRDYFIEDLKYGTNEKLRTGKAIDYDSIFGTNGSFRKLNVD